MTDNEGTEKSDRIIPFSGKKSDWRICSRCFLAAAAKKKYKNVLLGIDSVPADKDILNKSKKTDTEKKHD